MAKKEQIRVGSLLLGQYGGEPSAPAQLAIVLRIPSTLLQWRDGEDAIDVYWLGAKVVDWEYPCYLDLVNE